MKTPRTQLVGWLKPKITGLRMRMSLPHAAVHGARAWAAHSFVGGPAPVRILVIGDRANTGFGEQFAPMTRHIGALRREFGHVLRFRYVDDVLAQGEAAFAGCQAVIFSLHFLLTQAQVEQLLAKFKLWADKQSVALIHFDGHDEQLIQWLSVPAAVDLYVKKHALADRKAYERSYIGRSNLTDYAARTFGFDFSGDHVPHTPGLAASDAGKIKVGWNIALDDKIAKLAARLSARNEVIERDIDVMCRASPGRHGTVMYAMRSPATAAIQRLEGRFKVLAPTRKVDQHEYYREMLRSKICLCPFGFGELCWRDFEAALCGCLILKPDMSHVETAPDIFLPHQTYVPLAWDYSDLEEKAAYYLARPQVLERIAGAAQRLVHEAMTEKWFLDRYREVIVSALAQRPRRTVALGQLSTTLDSRRR